MATKAAKLRPVANDTLLLNLVELATGMNEMRAQIAAITPDADDIDIAVAKAGVAFDATIRLKPFVDPAVTVFQLERQPIPGLHFTKIMTRPVPGTVNRRFVTARIISPESPA